MYDEQKARRAISFINLLRHTSGEAARKPFDLQPWQIDDIVGPIFGTVDDEGYRIIREAFVLIGRKNGKTELAAALALYALFMDDEYGAEIYSAANSREQAALVYRAAVAMVRMNPALRKRCKIIESQKRIVRYDTNSFYRAISADSSTAHGFNAHMVIYDEIHEAKNRDLYDVLKTSMGVRRQPLFISITTAGEEERGPWWELFEYSKKIKQGIVQDPTFHPVLYYAEKNDDWKDETNWHKANPALGTFRRIEEMRATFKRALEIPTLETAFRRLYLNQVMSSNVRWLDIDKWTAAGKSIDMQLLLKRDCYGGLDLSSTTDITALSLVFPLPDNEYTAKYFFFIPEENMAERIRRDRVPYDVWSRKGQIITTPGNVIDYDYIFKKIMDLCKIVNIKEIAFDRWGAIHLSTKLEAEGITMVGFGQGFASMSGPTKELISLTLQKKFHNGGHPVMDWMASNMVLRQDPAGNIKPDKEKSPEKIDGMVATIMGLDRAMRHSIDTSVYDQRGVLEI